MTDMVRPHGVNFINLFVECGRLVDDELKEVMGRRLSSEKLELLVYRSAPGYDDSACDLVCKPTVKVSACSRRGVYAR
jgi:hypothetical protein